MLSYRGKSREEVDFYKKKEYPHVYLGGFLGTRECVVQLELGRVLPRLACVEDNPSSLPATLLDELVEPVQRPHGRPAGSSGALTAEVGHLQCRVLLDIGYLVLVSGEVVDTVERLDGGIGPSGARHGWSLGQLQCEVVLGF